MSLATFTEQNYNKLKNDCLKNGELFCDDLFELDVPNVTWLRPKSIVEHPKFFEDGASRFDVIQGKTSDCWLLVAMANLTMNPTLFHHVVPKNQGFEDDYAGIFRFNIWQCGKWVEVVVDDRLPTKEGSHGSKELVFVRSKQKNEFWSALLEKAYAKLYGSYNELTDGWFNEAIVDFTGGIVERVFLNPAPENLEKVLSGFLTKGSFICVFMSNNPLVKEHIMDNGLVKGHAYSVTKIQTMHLNKGGSVCLVRLRNPWGKIEWKGPWSDSSPEWQMVSTEEKTKIGLVFDNDGEFWMPLEDFSKNFEYMDVCHLGPEEFTNTGIKAWESHSFKGHWTKGISAGGFDPETFYLNPQYRIDLTDPDDDDSLCTVIVGLMQRNKTRKVWHKIGFTALRLEDPEKSAKKPLNKEYINNNFKNSSSSKFSRRREIVVRDRWQPGVYCILPSTREPKKEGNFLLRVYSEKKSHMEEHEIEIGESVPTFTKESIKYSYDNDKNTKLSHTPTSSMLLQKNEEEITEYFKKIAGVENEITWQGLQKILDYALKSPSTSETSSDPEDFFTALTSFVSSLFPGQSESNFTKYECRSMIEVLDDDHSGRMNLREFQVLWRKLRSLELVFSKHSLETDYLEVADLGMALKEAGYTVKNSDLGRLVRKYCDHNDKLSFDDFVMCTIEVLKTTS